MKRRRTLGCGTGLGCGAPPSRMRSAGLGSTKDVHEMRALKHLQHANAALGNAMNARTCNDRVANAIEAYGAAVAADVQLASAGKKPLGDQLAIRAMSMLATCVSDRSLGPDERPKRRFELIQGGKTRGRR